MSKIATGVRFTEKENFKAYGYLAIFADGDVRRHTTNFKKTHCVRVKIGSFMKWDNWRIVPGAEVRDGMQLRECRFGQYQYEWFTNEAEAVREVRKAASMTIRPWLGMRYHGGEIHPLNEPIADTPYYETLEIVEPRVVWERPAGVDSLVALNDPRIKVSTPAMVAQALAQLAATYVSDFTPQEVA